MLKSLLRWHRPLAMLAAIPVLAWSLTGLLHPVMSRWQPSAVAMKPPAEMLAPPSGMVWSDLPAPAKVLPPALPLRELRALTWQQKPYWMAQMASGQRLYFDARTGHPAAIEQALVIALARHYTGSQAEILDIREVHAFDHEYAFVSRYLPVWRVAFAEPDGLVAFIEPRSLLLTGLTNTWKTRFSTLFANAHSWKWWSHEPSRDVAMALLLSAAWLLVVSGLVRAVMTKRSQDASSLKRWHRRIGWLVAAAALAWTSSAIFHVLAIDKTRPAFTTYPLKLSFTPAQVVQAAPINIDTRARLQVLATPYGPLWHWQFLKPAGGDAHAHHGSAPTASTAPAAQNAAHAEHEGKHGGGELIIREAYVSATSGETIMPLDYVRALTGTVAPGAKWLTCEPVTTFNSEYGFAQKRLPVYKVKLDAPGHLAVYVDPVDAAVAAVVRDLDRAEGFSFGYLHKAAWLDALGKNTRDALLGSFALLIFAMTCAGLSFLRRR